MNASNGYAIAFQTENCLLAFWPVGADLEMSAREYIGQRNRHHAVLAIGRFLGLALAGVHFGLVANGRRDVVLAVGEDGKELVFHVLSCRLSVWFHLW